MLEAGGWGDEIQLSLAVNISIQSRLEDGECLCTRNRWNVLKIPSKLSPVPLPVLLCLVASGAALHFPEPVAWGSCEDQVCSSHRHIPIAGCSFYCSFLCLASSIPAASSHPSQWSLCPSIPLPLWFHPLWPEKGIWKERKHIHLSLITVYVVIIVLFLLWVIVGDALLCLIYKLGIITGKYGDNKNRTLRVHCHYSPSTHWGSSGMRCDCLLNHFFLEVKPEIIKNMCDID